jgi:iron complex transport system ATP-binding protein
MLKIRDLTAGYGGKIILNAIELDVAQGCVAALIGPNGSGKTTLIRAASGVLPLKTGEISVDEKSILSLPEVDRSRLISVVPQIRNTPPAFTVREVVALGRSPWLNWLGQYSNQDEQLVQQVMTQTGLIDLADRSMGELSGGEQQRVYLARALAQDTPVMLLDEPTAHLDLQYQINLMKTIFDLAHPSMEELQHGARQRAVLVAMHDLNLLSRFADRVILLDAGKVVATGTPAEVLDPELLSRVYRLPLSILQDEVSGQTVVIPDLPHSQLSR